MSLTKQIAGIAPALFIGSIALLTGTTAQAQTASASYRFANTLNAESGTASTLVATDPLNVSSFGTATVFGKTTNIYNFGGNKSNMQQGGLTLSTAGLLSPTNYAVEMVFKFNENAGEWRRIIDVENRRDDNGFYVNRSNSLAVYPVSATSNTFALNTYYHVILSVANDNVTVYQNGTLAFTVNTNIMNINNANNPNALMNFFLDNTDDGGQQEYSSGSISLLRVYNSSLTAGQAQTKYAEVSGAVVPEASTVGLLGSVLLPAVGLVVRRRKALGT